MSDLHDDELRDALWGASGEECDTGTALGQVEVRVRRIRRRRMDIAGIGLLVALVVTLGIASRARTDDSPNRPASVVTAAPPVSLALPTTTPSTEAPPADTTPVPSSDVVVGGAPAPADSAGPAADDTAPDDSAAEMATADDPASTAPADDAPPGTAKREAPPASAHAARTEQTFTGAGGRLTVGVTDGGLTFVSATARNGYAAGAPVVGATSVEIDFRSRAGRSRIHVDLINGRLVPTISNDDGGDGGHDRRPGRTSSTTAAPPDATNAGSRGATNGDGTDGTAGTSGGGAGTGTGGTGSDSGSGTRWGDRSGRA